ncbi:MAG TPA: DEAD/DEAH box helicase, partial [Gemmatimonadales bacterium]|nr:DEAD/DEAH box helicase [Gemmatimonadales bacterium]
GDAERVAITCAALGVDAAELDLPVPLDRTAYRRALETLTARGLVDRGRLTAYGREVEAMPVDRAWGEMLVHADGDLIPIAAVCSSIDSLHRMTRDERDLHGLVSNGSDHLTAYNVYAEAVNHHGYLGEVYGLPRHLFEDGLEEWAERRGVLVKAIEDTALGMASVYRALELPLPKELPYVSKETRRRFADLVARIMPFDLVIDEHTADGQEARVSKRSMAGSWGAVAGNLRFFADRFGIPRAAIEGTTLPYDLVREHATWGPPRIMVGGPRKHQRVVVGRVRQYFGFELETSVEVLEGRFPPQFRNAALDALADALLAGDTVHPGQGKIRRASEKLAELWRRSGGALVNIEPPSLRQRIRAQLEQEGVESWESFVRAQLAIDPAELVDPKVRERLEALPDKLHLKGDVAPIEYEVQDGRGVARVTLREGQARRLRAGDIPPLDRPLHFAVRRGSHAPILADSLDDLRDALDRQPRRERGERQSRGDPPAGGRPGGRGGGRGGSRTSRQRHQRKRRR